MKLILCGSPEDLTAFIDGLASQDRDQLDRIEATVDAILDLERTMRINVQGLLDAVNRTTTIDQAILALVNAIVAQNKDLAEKLAQAIADNDPAAIAEIQKAIDDSASVLEANVATLQEAVTNNTPQQTGGSETPVALEPQETTPILDKN